MVGPDADIQNLSDSLVKEIVNAVGLPNTAGMQRTFDRLFQRATRRLAAIGVTTDRLIAESGLSRGAEWMYSNFCSHVTVHGKENIPLEGPLLIVSNHSGTYDSLVLTSLIGREDLKIISSDIQYFKELPNIAKHLIFLSDEITDRVAGTRAGIRQLQKGGAFLIFGTGRIDPDPEIYLDADKHIERWSASIDLFLRTAPGARVLISIISGVLSKRWGHHPITWLRRIDWQKRRIAEYGQVIGQLLFPGKPNISPSMTIAPPVNVEELRRESQGDRLLPAVIARGRTLLADHIAWIQAETRKGMDGH
jgi:hypothetical protein